MKHGVVCTVAAVSLLAARPGARAVDYDTPAAELTQDFDSLPTDVPSNANIQTVYLHGWQDDSVTVAGDHIGLPGWFLWHPLAPSGGEGGTNGRQRLRFGTANNTGSFWAFSQGVASPDKALGSIGSTTVAPDNRAMLIGWKITNATGVTLTQFTLSFDGEQWRHGTGSTGETLTCGYSLAATDATWTTESFTTVPALAFAAPVKDDLSGNQIDGNVLGLVPGITATVSGLVWAPGTTLWLRWEDPQQPSLADDGLAIDNVSFSALAAEPVPAPQISFTRGESSAFVTWRGDARFSALLEQSPDLTTWAPVGSPTPETEGTNTLAVPEGLLGTTARFFRLVRSLP